MSKKDNILSILKIAFILCVLCSLVVSFTFVLLKDKQEINKKLDKQKNVLLAAGLIESGQKLSPNEIDALYKNIKSELIDLKTGQQLDSSLIETFDEKKESKDINQSYLFSKKEGAGEARQIAKRAIVYKVLKKK